MNHNKNIVILYSSGKNPDNTESIDNQDTLVQLDEISNILISSGYNPSELLFNGSLDSLAIEINKINPCCIFNLVETLNGTDRMLYFAAAFIEYLNYKYTGCPAWSLATLASKTAVKKILLKAELPTPDYLFTSSTNKSKNKFNPIGNHRWIIKPDTEHASYGITENSIVNTKDIVEKLDSINSSSRLKWYAEQFIPGREFNISIIDNGHGEPKVLTPVEMTLGGTNPLGESILDFAAKWQPDSDNYDSFQHKFTFDDADSVLINKMQHIAHDCWQIFGFKGAARIDFRVDKDSSPWIIDINPNPCLGSDAGLVIAANKLLNLSQKDLILHLINSALNNHYRV